MFSDRTRQQREGPGIGYPTAGTTNHPSTTSPRETPVAVRSPLARFDFDFVGSHFF